MPSSDLKKLSTHAWELICTVDSSYNNQQNPNDFSQL